MQPYIICHMGASIDGRIDRSMVDKISVDKMQNGTLWLRYATARK